MLEKFLGKVVCRKIEFRLLIRKFCSKEVQDAWEHKKSIQANFEDMGLSFDPNKTIKIANEEKQIKVSVTSNENDEWHEAQIVNSDVPRKAYVAEALEKDARAPRVKLFRLPKSQVEWITYLIDKYGNDYKAMERDKKIIIRKHGSSYELKLKGLNQFLNSIPNTWKQRAKQKK